MPVLMRLQAYTVDQEIDGEINLKLELTTNSSGLDVTSELLA